MCSALDMLTRMAVSSAVRRMKDFSEFRYGAGAILDRCRDQDAPWEVQYVPARWKYMDPVEAAVRASGVAGIWNGSFRRAETSADQGKRKGRGHEGRKEGRGRGNGQVQSGEEV